MQIKEHKRQRRARKTRQVIKESGRVRMTVERSHNHMTAQIINTQGQTLLSASTREKAIKKRCEEKGIKHCGNIQAAKIVGEVIADRANQQGINKVAFDRSGRKYHGRVKALAEAAREAGIEC